MKKYVVGILFSVFVVLFLGQNTHAATGSGYYDNESIGISICSRAVGLSNYCDPQYSYGRITPWQTGIQSSGGQVFTYMDFITKVSHPASGIAVTFDGEFYVELKSGFTGGHTNHHVVICGVEYTYLELFEGFTRNCNKPFIVGPQTPSVSPTTRNEAFWFTVTDERRIDEGAINDLIAIKFSFRSTLIFPSTATWNTYSGAFGLYGTDFQGSELTSRGIIGLYAPNTLATAIKSLNSFYRVATTDDEALALMEETNSLLRELQEQNEETNNLLRDQNARIDELNATMEAQQQAEQDRYDQEKQEEAEREGALGDQSQAGLVTPSWSLVFPIIGLFSYSDSCVSISSLATWLNLSESTLCPFFPQYIRDGVTPIVGMFSSVLLFYFVYRWLNRGNR